jgi:hypothetical protein
VLQSRQLRMPMRYSIAADAIAFFHAVLTALIFLPLVSWAFGAPIPRWLAIVCLCAATVSAASYAFLRDCFINPVERHFRRLAKQETYEGSFVAHHVHRLTGLRMGRRTVFLILLLCGLAAGATVVYHTVLR